MKSRASTFIALLGLVALGAACSGSPDAVTGVNVAVASDVVVVEEMYRLTGQGNYFGAGAQPDLVVNAIRTFSGEIKGNVIVPQDGIGKLGSVVGIVPPSASYNYWCVASTLDGQPGITLLIYINDVPNGIDQVTFNSGPGIACATSPVPPFEWTPLLTGNFTGTVKVK